MQTDASCCDLSAPSLPPRPRAESAPERSVIADKLHAGTAEYRRACLALFLGGFATFSLLYNLQPLMPLLAHGFGLSPALASGAVSAATIALAAALIPAAILADRVGRKPVMVGALSLSTVFTLVGAFAGDFHSLLVSRALLGMTLAGLPAVAMAYLSEEFAPTSLARAMGLYISGNALGGLCGRFLAVLIAEHADWRVALFCLAASSTLTT
ncbi:MAG: MFS transporter, partial [Rhodocyclaceae bacterium]